MIRQINTFGNPILNKKAVQILGGTPNIITANITGEPFKAWPQEVIDHIKDLKDTGEAHANCVGLSSCQIWDDKNTDPLAVFIIKLSTDGGLTHVWQEFINPEIKTSGKTVKVKESCMSVPGYSKEISRESNVTITFNVLNSSERITQKFTQAQGLLPIIVQHEMEHLEGKLIKK